MATGTRNVFRSLGGVIGIAVSTAVHYAVLDKALQTDNAIPNWLRGSVLDGTWSIEDPQTEQYVSAILKARMQGFRIIFIITVPLVALCLETSFLVDDIVLKHDLDRSGGQGAAMTTEPARNIKKRLTDTNTWF